MATPGCELGSLPALKAAVVASIKLCACNLRIQNFGLSIFCSLYNELREIDKIE